MRGRDRPAAHRSALTSRCRSELIDVVPLVCVVSSQVRSNTGTGKTFWTGNIYFLMAHCK
jgi:hypothetical protein